MNIKNLTRLETLVKWIKETEDELRELKGVNVEIVIKNGERLHETYKPVLPSADSESVTLKNLAAFYLREVIAHHEANTKRWYAEIETL